VVFDWHDWVEPSDPDTPGTLRLDVGGSAMRLSTKVIGLAILLIVVPIPVLPPFVGTVIGLLLLAVGLFLRFMDL